MNTEKIQSILKFWFDDLNLTQDYFSKKNPFWFAGGKKVDDLTRTLFGKDLENAVAGKYDSWQNTPKGALALIILLDQFSLSLCREQPQAYLQSEMAIPVARMMIDQGWDWAMTPAERVFIYLPFEHSEKLEDQELAVSLFEKMHTSAPKYYQDVTAIYSDYAKRHHRVVKRYGRFPDRNEVFGRNSTPQELDFLASDEAPF